MVIRQSTTSTKCTIGSRSDSMKYFYLTNKEFLYTCNVRGSAHTVCVTVTRPTLFLLFLSMLFFYVLQKDAACGEPVEPGSGGTMLYTAHRTMHRTVCTDLTQCHCAHILSAPHFVFERTESNYATRAQTTVVTVWYVPCWLTGCACAAPVRPICHIPLATYAYD